MNKLSDMRYHVVLPFPEGSQVIEFADDLDDAHLAALVTEGPIEIHDQRTDEWIETGPEDAVRVLRRLQRRTGSAYRFLYGRYAGKRPADLADDFERRWLPGDWLETVTERLKAQARATLTGALASVPEALYMDGRAVQTWVEELAAQYGEVGSVRFEPHEVPTGPSPYHGCGRVVIEWVD